AQQQVYYGLEFLNYWNLRSFYIHKNTTDDDHLTRGGPTVKSPGWNYGHFQVSTDPRQRAVFDVTIDGSRGYDGTASYDFNPGIALKPASNIFLQLGPSFGWSQNKQQYIERLADPTQTAFGGTRYLFGFVTS